MKSFFLGGKMAVITTAKGDQILVDDEDYEWLSGFVWFIRSSGSGKVRYAEKNDSIGEGRRTKQRMHRLLLGFEYGDRRFVDHINGNGLDNRKENLRVCTRTQNTWNQGISSANTSGYKGVSYHKGKGKWQAGISVNSKRKHLGMFETPEQAHQAYCDAAKAMHGEFVNFGANNKK